MHLQDCPPSLNLTYLVHTISSRIFILILSTNCFLMIRDIMVHDHRHLRLIAMRHGREGEGNNGEEMLEG